MKNLLIILCISSLSVFLTTCRKISKYPIRMNGVWYAAHTNCGFIIIINDTGYGSHESTNDSDGCDHAMEHGKIRFTKNKIFIGHTGYKIINKPKLYSSTDSVTLPGRYHKSNGPEKALVLGSMTLKDSKLNGGKEFTYYKIIEY